MSRPSRPRQLLLTGAERPAQSSDGGQPLASVVKDRSAARQRAERRLPGTSDAGSARFPACAAGWPWGKLTEKGDKESLAFGSLFLQCFERWRSRVVAAHDSASGRVRGTRHGFRNLPVLGAPSDHDPIRTDTAGPSSRAFRALGVLPLARTVVWCAKVSTSVCRTAGTGNARRLHGPVGFGSGLATVPVRVYLRKDRNDEA